MTSILPRNRREIVTLNGIFDDFSDIPFSKATWEETTDFADARCEWDVVAAPGGAGGNALKLRGQVHTNPSGAFIEAFSSVSPYRNKSNLYYIPIDTYRWKMQTQFRMYIVSDEGGSTYELSMSPGFNLDGCVLYDDTDPIVQTHTLRVHASFNVTRGKAGLVTHDAEVPIEIIKVSWAGSYNTYYDVRIEWEYDWFSDPLNYQITCWVGTSQLWTVTMAATQWRRARSSYPWNQFQERPPLSAPLGRCGPSTINYQQTGGTGGNWIEVYYKDLLITLIPSRSIKWKYQTSLIGKKKADMASFTFVSESDVKTYGQGMDIQIFKRDTLTENWNPVWRGIIRTSDKVRKQLYRAEAESYNSVLFGEKTDVLTLTSKTTGEIVQAAIANPTKAEFDTTTFFDTTTDTYSRTYVQHPKLAIHDEMMALEGFILFLDTGNNYHFNDIRNNDLEKDLIWGQSRILKPSIKDVFVRKPNKIRVNGSGVSAERSLASDNFINRSIQLKNINRPDLTTQAEVDAELDFQCSLYDQSIVAIELKMKADWALKRGYLVRLTLPQYEINAQRFLISNIDASRNGLMTVGLLEASPILPMLISELKRDAESKEAEGYAQDTQSSNDTFELQATARTLVHAEYEIEFDSVVEQSGTAIVTDVFINELLALFNAESPTEPQYLGYGTGTTAAKYSDTTLETESARPSATRTAVETVAKAKTNGWVDWHRAMEYSVVVVDPTAISELGIFNAAAAGDMGARAAFSAYTKTGSVTFRIRLRIIPVESSTYMSILGLYNIVDVWLLGTQPWVAADLWVCYSGTQCLFHPSMVNYDITEEIYGATLQRVPGAKTLTHSITKFPTQQMIEYITTGTYSGGTSAYVGWAMGLYANLGTGDEGFIVLCFNRGVETMDFYNNQTANFKLRLKFTQGQKEAV